MGNSYDCDYAILRMYNSESDGSCGDSYGEEPMSMGCYEINFGITTNLQLYCADNGTSGGDVAATVWSGADCTGFALFEYTNALTAFAQFGLDATCADMVCYQSDFVSFEPTSSPTT